MRIKLSDYPVENCDCGFNIKKISDDELWTSFYACAGHRQIINKQKKLINIIKIAKEPRP